MINKLILPIAWLSILWSVALTAPDANAKNKLMLTIPPDVMQDYFEFIEGKNELEMSNYAGTKSRRDVVEIILVRQALALGGYDADIEFIEGYYYARNLHLLRDGLIVMSLDSVWLSDAKSIDDYAFISQAVIEHDTYEAGLYTTENNHKALAAKDINDVRRLATVSNKQWSVDWQTLESMQLRRLENILEWETMVKIVNLGWADFVLAPFQATPDLSFQVNDVKLVPIPNLKIKLKGSRHFVVSKRHPQGPAVFTALEKGLKQLKAQGRLQRAYQDAGLFNSQVKDWKEIN